MSQVQWEIDLTEWFVQGTFIASVVFAMVYIPFYDWRETLTGKAVTVLILAIAGALFRSVLVLWGVITVTVRPDTVRQGSATIGFWNEFFTWLSIVSLGAAGVSITLLLWESLRGIFSESENKIICKAFRLGRQFPSEPKESVKS